MASIDDDVRDSGAGKDEGSRPPVSALEVDAVLRGERDSTPAIDAVIADLDYAVSLNAIPEPILVVIPRPAAWLPPGVDDGATVTEPTFLRAYFSTPDISFPDAETVLTLRLEPGIPAIFVSRDDGPGPGTLLLCRGITWEVARVLRELAPVQIFGRTVLPTD